MDISVILSVLHGWIFILISFVVFLSIAMFRGRQTLINLMVGSYIGLLLYPKFPFLDTFMDSAYGAKSESIVELVTFTIFTLLATWLFARLMPREYLEQPFESILKKVLLALVATILAFTFSTYYLPVADLVSIGSPLPEVLFSDKFSFLWLILPLVALFFLF